MERCRCCSGPDVIPRNTVGPPNCDISVSNERQSSMSRIKMLGMALIAVFAFASAISATSAIALELPDVHLLPGETSATATGSTVKKAEEATLETEVGSKLVG